MPWPRIPVSKPCRESDWSRLDFLGFWADLGDPRPAKHRKNWEIWAVCSAIMSGGPGRGLGFGVGKDRVAEWLTARSCEVVTTDLDGRAADARQWAESGQWAERVDRRVDMRAIPDDLKAGQFDFCYSVSALEHLGSIEESRRFFLDSLQCLRPGGLSVHVTEAGRNGGLSLGPVCVFSPGEINGLARDVAASGGVMALDWSFGERELDLAPDRPPWSLDRHVSLMVGNIHATSCLLAAKAKE